jgi:hypothetical protein
VRKLLITFFFATAAFGQGVPSPGPGTVGSKVAFPSGFAYVASSVTGCYFLVGNTDHCGTALNVNPASGQLWIVKVTWKSITATATFGCTNNTSWTPVGSPVTSSDNVFRGQLFWTIAVTGASPEICSPTISSLVMVLDWEAAAYTYTGTISSPDGTPVYTNTSASGTTATISGLTTSGSSDLLFAACIGVSGSCSAGTGYTGRNDTNACLSAGNISDCAGGTKGHDFNGVIGELLEDKVNVAAGAQSATFTTGNNDLFFGGLIAF